MRMLVRLVNGSREDSELFFEMLGEESRKALPEGDSVPFERMEASGSLFICDMRLLPAVAEFAEERFSHLHGPMRSDDPEGRILNAIAIEGFLVDPFRAKVAAAEVGNCIEAAHQEGDTRYEGISSGIQSCMQVLGFRVRTDGEGNTYLDGMDAFGEEGEP